MIHGNSSSPQAVFQCGHPKTRENTYLAKTVRGVSKPRCKLCHKERSLSWWHKKRSGK